jgi:hypothetical protein
MCIESWDASRLNGSYSTLQQKIHERVYFFYMISSIYLLLIIYNNDGRAITQILDQDNVKDQAL